MKNATLFKRLLMACFYLPFSVAVPAQSVHKNILNDTVVFDQSSQTYHIRYTDKKLNYKYEIKAIPKVVVGGNTLPLKDLSGISGDSGWVSGNRPRQLVWDPRKDEINNLKGIEVYLDTAVVRQAKLPRFWGLELHGSNSAPLGLKVIRFGPAGFYAACRIGGIPPAYRYTVSDLGEIDYNESGIYVIGSERRLAGFAVTGGPVVQVARNVYTYAGVGYGLEQLFWQYEEYNLDREPTGSSWALNETIDHKGTCADLGVLIRFGRVFIDIGVSTIQFESYQVLGGIGISLSQKS